MYSIFELSDFVTLLLKGILVLYLVALFDITLHLYLSLQSIILILHVL